MFQNMLNHPKSTIIGFLISITIAAPILQSVDWSHITAAQVFGLLGALAAAFLGALTRDPSDKSTVTEQVDTGSTKKLGVLMLCALMLPASIPVTGCTAGQVNQAVSQISAYLPTVLSLLTEAITIYNAVGAKQTNPDASRVLADVQTTLTALQGPLNDYLSATSASDKNTAWANVQALVDTAVKDADTLLAAAHVKDPQTAATGTIIIGALDAAIHVLDAFVTGAQTKAQVQAKLAKRTVKISTLDTVWTARDKEMIAKGVSMPYPVVLQQAESLGF